MSQRKKNLINGKYFKLHRGSATVFRIGRIQKSLYSVLKRIFTKSEQAYQRFLELFYSVNLFNSLSFLIIIHIKCLFKFCVCLRDCRLFYFCYRSAACHVPYSYIINRVIKFEITFPPFLLWLLSRDAEFYYSKGRISNRIYSKKTDFLLLVWHLL